MALGFADLARSAWFLDDEFLRIAIDMVDFTLWSPAKVKPGHLFRQEIWLIWK
jgi:hypothetical protein